MPRRSIDDSGEYGDGFEEAMGHMRDEVENGVIDMPQWLRDAIGPRYAWDDEFDW